MYCVPNYTNHPWLICNTCKAKFLVHQVNLSVPLEPKLSKQHTFKFSLSKDVAWLTPCPTLNLYTCDFPRLMIQYKLQHEGFDRLFCFGHLQPIWLMLTTQLFAYFIYLHAYHITKSEAHHCYSALIGVRCGTYKFVVPFT